MVTVVVPINSSIDGVALITVCYWFLCSLC